MKTLQKLSDLSGRKAILTGGVGHIALAVGEALVELGADVSLMDLSADACQERLDVLAQTHKHNGVALPCDLKDEQATREAVRKGISEMGGLDILVHTAAYVGTTQVAGWAVPFEEQGVDAWDAATRVNLTSAFVMVQEAQEALSASGHGAVVFFASHYGLVGPDMRMYDGTSMANPAGYAASKGGLIQLTRYLATLMAPKFRVNSISPGGLWRGQPESFTEQYTYRTPMNRMATEEDLKGAVSYLASDLSAYVTGHNLVVDGGLTSW